ncbi:hypothetical protein N7456_001955 [Penicillium angulare]|uniref:Glycosyltransferase family 28 N-terminal domain-containing protein n=1 Tax=Penicillium angulare TaxID=116970 RepID=A0A9W9G7F3_9EURO|nr:hypothetical protein N7456_001955 [Penicillium angulare]
MAAPQSGPDSASEVQVAPPYSRYVEEELALETGRVHGNGRIDINLESRVARALAHIIDAQQEDIQNPPPHYDHIDAIQVDSYDFPLRLNIVIQIVGSRGDVQPFIALGTALKRYGHRVRIATHDTFATFVRDHGLEFYPIGGDPAELMAYMVKNPGLIPRMETLRGGEVKKKQVMIATMLDGCWRSCIEDDPVTQEPFVADAIIANPPSFAHIHCAQALGIPVHLMFTMPWSSTKAFPHPLANLSSASMNPRTANWVSYGVVEWLTWQGLGAVINQWRASIHLSPVPNMEGPCLAEVLKVPFTYCWSPALIPKPQDWGSHIDICGFLFRDAPTYSPPVELEKFLQLGEPPVYIGFGSIVVSDPERLIQTILSAVSKLGIRAIISKGWSEISGPPSSNIYYIEDCPHEWLFQHVAAVVHHGGSGTTACGLSNSRPTAIVPFFGDQPFWGNMVARAGAGPKPIPYASLTIENLAAAITYCLTTEAKAAAEAISIKMRTESGVQAAVNSFHRHLPSDRMGCDLTRTQAAVLRYKKGNHTLKLSALAAQILIKHGKVEAKNIRWYAYFYFSKFDILHGGMMITDHDISFLYSYQSNPIIVENRRWDPVTGVFSATMSTTSDLVLSTTEMVTKPYKEYRDARGSRPNSPRNSITRSQTDLGTHVDNEESQKGRVTAGRMVGATLKGLGKFTGVCLRGAAVDIPHAAAEGFRQLPQLYGEKPKEYGPVKDWKSGIIVGGRNLVDGMSEGLSGLITQPIKGAKEDGALGAMKGLAKGTAGLATKIPSGEIYGPASFLDNDDLIWFYDSLTWIDGLPLSWNRQEPRDIVPRE